MKSCNSKEWRTEFAYKLSVSKLQRWSTLFLLTTADLPEEKNETEKQVNFPILRMYTTLTLTESLKYVIVTLWAVSVKGFVFFVL
jgi:hypothetical protein